MESALVEPVLSEPDWLTRTRDCYDAVVDTYTERYGHGDLPERPLEFGVLRDFADRLRAEASAAAATAVDGAAAGRVLDVGCGPGRWTCYLADAGLDAGGMDLSPAMVERARLDHPGLSFEVGSMTSLPVAATSVSGVLAWYSTIHLPDEALAIALAEFARILRPGGYVLLGFQAGDEHLLREDAYGHGVPLDVFLRTPQTVMAMLEDAGFVVQAHTVREPEGAELRPQATVTARKP